MKITTIFNLSYRYWYLFQVYSTISVLSRFSSDFPEISVIHILDAVFHSLSWSSSCPLNELSIVSDICGFCIQEFCKYHLTFLNCLNISSQISFCFLTADPCLFQSITHVIVSSIKEALIWRLLSHFCNADWTTFARTSSCNYALRLCSSFNKIAHFSRRESIHKSTASPLLPRCSITTQVSHKLWRSYYTGIWKHFGESLQLAIIINHSLLLIKTLLIRTSPSVFQGSYPSVVIINLSY